MTTYFQFSLNNRTAPSFIPTFDGNQYTITILWNISSKRYYVMCKTLDGTLVFLVPIISSMTALSLIDVEYDEENLRVKATVDGNIPLPIGAVFNANLINNEPTGYNGYGLASVLSKTEFIYNLTPNPGLCTTFGAVQILASITQGYFQSTMIYRNGNFEVSP